MYINILKRFFKSNGASLNCYFRIHAREYKAVIQSHFSEMKHAANRLVAQMRRGRESFLNIMSSKFLFNKGYLFRLLLYKDSHQLAQERMAAKDILRAQ